MEEFATQTFETSAAWIEEESNYFYLNYKTVFYHFEYFHYFCMTKENLISVLHRS